jgi:fructose-bisphosphate aldolase class I
MKPIPGLRALCERAVELGVFGTKMRSVVQLANEAGVTAVVEQQFEVAKEIIAAGLVPIIEPEVDITSNEKQEAEALLRDGIATQLDALGDDELVMLKLSIPTVDDFYADLIAHPKVLRVVALSGGYPRDEANERLSRQHGMIASFSRALTESLSAGQSDAEFDAALSDTIDGIYAASIT